MKYSMSYNGLNLNFVISHNLKTNPISNKELALFCITYNIINRSPFNKPSEYLTSKIGESKITKFIYSKVNKNSLWDKTIKGGSNYNPALNFYKNYLKDYIDDYIYYNFLPECLLSDVIKENTLSNKKSMDFYSPILNTCIEIDGNQHSQTEQTIKDKKRDLLLKNHSINKVRITTKETNLRLIEKLKYTLESAKIKNSKILESFVNYDSLDKLDIEYAFIARFQMVILELFTKGIIHLDDRELDIQIKCNDSRINGDVFEYAYNDLMELILNLSNILSINLNSYPILNILTCDEFIDVNSLKMDIDINRYYSENLNDDVIYISNDYFLYKHIADYENNFIKFKNYYKVACCDYKYHLDFKDSKRHDSFLYILKRCFGFTSFNPNQEEIIVDTLNRQSVIGILPTSAGKSLCYQFSSLLLPGLTLVISPLKSLMQDQFSNILEYGISNVAYINSDTKKMYELIKEGKSLISLISPERFFSMDFTNYLTLNSNKYKLIAIDEVHCISEWGHDFRTSYLCLLHSLNKYFNEDTCLLGLTATASPNVADDILSEFNTFRNSTKVITSDNLNRKELTLYPIVLDDNKDDRLKKEWLDNMLKEGTFFFDKTIVFTKCARGSSFSSCINLAKKTRDKIDKLEDKELVNYFCSDGNIANNLIDERDYQNYEKLFVSNDVKMEKFKKGEINLLYATKAFGMGVNIKDIRNTVHLGLPSSLESLYQEFGRAGRDKNPSNCYIVFNKENQKSLDLLNKDFTIKGLKESTNLFNELNQNIYFLTSSNLDIEQDSDLVLKFYNLLKENNYEELELNQIYDFLEMDHDIQSKQLVDKILYRSLLLGFIDMWSITYTDKDFNNPVYFNLKFNDISLDDMIDNLTDYISRYENDYIYNQAKDLKSIIKTLITWIFNNFVWNRVESLKLLYRYCSVYTNNDELMNAITLFLSTDKNLRGVVLSKNPKKWFKYLKENDVETRLHKINRYLESYHNSTSLNYLSALTKAELGEDDNELEFRMSNAMDKIKTFDKSDIDYIFVNTIKSIKNEKQKKILGKLLIEHFPNKYKEIYLATENEKALEMIVYLLDKNVERIGGIIDDRLK